MTQENPGGKRMNRSATAALALTALLVIGGGIAPAQDYPNRPIRIMVGFAPGGGVDTVARLVGQELAKRLGRSVVIENRPGAAGTIGAAAAARSEADGYTLVMLPGGHPLYGATHKSLPFDTVNGFEWISTIVTLQFIAVVRGESRYRSMNELIAAAREHPRPSPMPAPASDRRTISLSRSSPTAPA
jgi:tripartite-type tricarboxylate transporter receptor subunit TctC